MFVEKRYDKLKFSRIIRIVSGFDTNRCGT